MEKSNDLQNELESLRNFAKKLHSQRNNLEKENLNLKAIIKKLENELDNTKHELKKYKLKYSPINLP